MSACRPVDVVLMDGSRWLAILDDATYRLKDDRLTVELADGEAFSHTARLVAFSRRPSGI